jgi:hypothetical protein
MSRNGSGTYSLPAGNPVVTGTTISSTWANNTLTDIATALTGSLAADGQTTATGNLKMGNNRVTGLSDGLASTDAATVSQVAASVAGLGTMSTQNANNVAITGGAISGTTGDFTNFTASGTASFTSTGAVKIPAGTTAQQPTPTTGMIRYNSTNAQFEGYGASSWNSLGSGAAGSNTQVQYNNSGALAGSSGLTFNGTTLQATALQTATLNSTSGVLATQNGMTGIAKAWVNWTGGSSPSIQNSFNVSSITRNGTGDYSINFTTAMPNANYVVAGTCQQTLSNYGTSIGFPFQAVATTSVARICTAFNATTFDAGYASVAVFGT